MSDRVRACADNSKCCDIVLSVDGENGVAECLNETLFVSLSQARSVLDAWRTDYNGVRPHSALANKTPEEFRAQHIAVAASAGNGQNFSPGLSS